MRRLLPALTGAALFAATGLAALATQIGRAHV